MLPVPQAKFTVKVGTVFESSHVPLHIWLQAVALLTSARRAFQQQPASPHPWRHPQDRLVHVAPYPRGNARRRARSHGRRRQIVEADETYPAQQDPNPAARSASGRPFTQERQAGPPTSAPSSRLSSAAASVRSFHVENADKATVNQIVGENIAREARVHHRRKPPLRRRGRPCRDA